MLKILFMGTPDFAQESLKSIYDAGFEIIGVVTNPDKPKGRGMKLAYSPVKEYALEKNLKIYQPIKIKNNSGQVLEYIVQPRNKRLGLLLVPKMVKKEDIFEIKPDDLKNIIDELKQVGEYNRKIMTNS